MKKYLLLLPLLLIGIKGFSQNTKPDYPKGMDSLKYDEMRNDLAKPQSLPGGMKSFREEVARRIDLSGFTWTQPFRMVVAFSVSKTGEMENIRLQESSGNAEFDQRIIDGIKRMRKKKWTPAKRDGEPVESFYTLPLNFNPPK